MWALNAVPFEDKVENYAYADDVFTKEELDKIIELGLTKNATTGLIGGKNLRKNLKTRKSKTSWIEPCEESEWLFRKLTDVIVKANNDFFGFDLFGLMEPLQFTIYDEKGSKYSPHIDKIKNQITRKLSLVLQLSDPKEYEGGDLELFLEKRGSKIKKKRGYISIFPSYTLHGVKPVTSGKRYSLVVWAHGPAFK